MNQTTRKLAAIMFTDIVGYTKLMGLDETKALEIVRKNREIQKPIIEKHYGKWIKELGDGTMIQFNTALDAVSCAIEIQHAIQSQLEVQIRIGIHLGDLVFENNDVYGDGVNIASRLEAKAPAGAIYISDSVYKAIKGKGLYNAEYIGELKLKNVEEPVQTYIVSQNGSSGKSLGKSIKRNRQKYILYATMTIILIASIILRTQIAFFRGTEEKPTITVLPFSLNGEEDDQYLVDGLSEELIRSLGQVQSLSVINAISTKRYLGAVPDIFGSEEKEKQEYYVHGVVNKNDLWIQLSIELKNETDEVLWDNTYEADMADLPRLIGTISVDLTQSIKIKLGESLKARLTDVASVNPEVYELWLKGMIHIGKYTPEDFQKSIVYFKQAVDQYPGDARAWAGLAEGFVDVGHSPMAQEETWPSAKAAAIRAIQLDSTLAEGWAALAHIKTYFEWDYEGAEICYQKANELNPNLAMNHYHYAWHLNLLGRNEEAIREHRMAQKLDPFQPLHTNWLAGLYMATGQFEEAKKELKRSEMIMKEDPLQYNLWGRYYFKQGQFDSALFYFKKASAKLPPIKFLGECNFYVETGDIDNVKQCITEIKAFPRTGFISLMLANYYGGLDSLDQYFYHANYEPAHAWAPWRRVNEKNPKILRDPRFKQLMDKMNLPMPEGYETENLITEDPA